MKKKFVVIAAGVSLVACLVGCAPSEVNEAQKSIDAIGEVTVESRDAITEANAKYDALDEEDKSKVQNYQVLEEANKRLVEVLRSEIEVQIGKAGELGFDYFAQHYDMSEIESAKATAQEAIDYANEGEYANVYYALKNANKEFETYIEEERANSYSAPTNNGEYPFAVEAEEFAQNIARNSAMQPAVKQNSNYPFQINLFEAKTSDGLSEIGFCMADKWGYSYEYQVESVDTIEINVKGEDGEVRRAFVNSKLNLTNHIGTKDDAEVLIRNNSYLFKTGNGDLNLVIPDLEGGSFYIPYVF